MWYIHTMEYYSALKKEMLTHATIWMKLENIMLSETSQSQKDKYCIIPLIGGIQRNQIYRDRKQNSGYQGLREQENYYLMGTEFLFGMMKKILEMTGGEISTTI